jgi:hypothetical protein
MEPSYSNIRPVRVIQQILLHSLIPIACSALIGFVFYRWKVFNPHYPAFQFVESAALASAFFYALAYTRKRNAFAALLILFLLVLLDSRSTRMMYVLRDFFYTAGIAGAVLLYIRQLRTNPSLRGQYFGLVFSGILGVCTIVAWSAQLFLVEFAFVRHQSIDILTFISMAAFYGFLVGLGVGLGVVINRKILDGEERGKTVR